MKEKKITIKEETIFTDLIKREPSLLDKPLKDLIPLRFIGDAAIAAYRKILANTESLLFTKEQRAQTLKDGQDAGIMLLEIENHIGKLLRKELPDTGGRPRKNRSSEVQFLTKKQRETARTIGRNPKTVQKVIDEAKENEDIPTKRAVIQAVRMESAKRKVEAVFFKEEEILRAAKRERMKKWEAMSEEESKEAREKQNSTALETRLQDASKDLGHVNRELQFANQIINQLTPICRDVLNKLESQISFGTRELARLLERNPEPEAEYEEIEKNIKQFPLK